MRVNCNEREAFAMQKPSDCLLTYVHMLVSISQGICCPSMKQRYVRSRSESQTTLYTLAPRLRLPRQLAVTLSVLEREGGGGGGGGEEGQD